MMPMKLEKETANEINQAANVNDNKQPTINESNESEHLTPLFVPCFLFFFLNFFIFYFCVCFWLPLFILLGILERFGGCLEIVWIVCCFDGVGHPLAFHLGIVCGCL